MVWVWAISRRPRLKHGSLGCVIEFDKVFPAVFALYDMGRVDAALSLTKYFLPSSPSMIWAELMQPPPTEWWWRSLNGEFVVAEICLVRADHMGGL